MSPVAWAGADLQVDVGPGRQHGPLHLIHLDEPPLADAIPVPHPMRPVKLPTPHLAWQIATATHAQFGCSQQSNRPMHSDARCLPVDAQQARMGMQQWAWRRQRIKAMHATQVWGRARSALGDASAQRRLLLFGPPLLRSPRGRPARNTRTLQIRLMTRQHLCVPHHIYAESGTWAAAVSAGWSTSALVRQAPTCLSHQEPGRQGALQVRWPLSQQVCVPSHIPRQQGGQGPRSTVHLQLSPPGPHHLRR